MADKEKIIQYVIETSKLYSLDYQNYFFDFYNPEDSFDGVVKIFDDTKDFNWNIHRISEFLGISEKDVKRTSKKAKYALWEKYEVFDLYTMYEKQKKISMYKHEEYDELSPENIMFTLFDVPLYKKKYDFKDIHDRLVESLKEADKYIPGTYHKDATINNLQIKVEQFYDFPPIKDLLKYYFELYDRMSELFFKGLTQDLNQDEINEYNLAVSFFHAKEQCGTKLLHYSVLKENRDIYIKEGYTQLQSYLNIPDYMDFKPWKCKQLIEEKDILQQYQDIFPRTKERIKEFCLNIKNYTCWFVWSDELERVRKINENLPQYIIKADGEEVPNYETFYVHKTSDEIGEDYNFAKKLSKMASPSSQGGLLKKHLEYNRYNPTAMMKRILTKFGRDYDFDSNESEDLYSNKYDHYLKDGDESEE